MQVLFLIYMMVAAALAMGFEGEKEYYGMQGKGANRPDPIIDSGDLTGTQWSFGGGFGDFDPQNGNDGRAKRSLSNYGGGGGFGGGGRKKRSLSNYGGGGGFGGGGRKKRSLSNYGGGGGFGGGGRKKRSLSNYRKGGKWGRG